MLVYFGLVFIAGALVGAIVHRQVQRKQATNVFTSPDTDQADELRAEASQAVSERIAKRKERILQVARAQGRITNDGVEDLFCISDRTASTYLSELTEGGQLARQGSGRGTFYTPN